MAHEQHTPPPAVPPAEREGDGDSSSNAPEPTPSETRRRSETPAPPVGQSGSRRALRPSEASAQLSSPNFGEDVEDLLPLADVTQSLPPIPLSLFLPAPVSRAPTGGRALLRVGTFAAVLVAALIPLLRYTGTIGDARVSRPLVSAPLNAQSAQPEPPAPQGQNVEASAPEPAAPAPDPLAALELRLPSDPAEASDALVKHALTKLEAGDTNLAEALVSRALKLDDRNPRAAYALARVRLAQGNLEGAEGWAVLAVERRPRRTEYRALYAQVLERLGRTSDAEYERAQIRALKLER